MNLLNKATFLASAFAIGLGVSTAVHAEKIYLWYTTDASGKRVPKYGATPPLGVDATLISESKPSAPKAPAAAPQLDTNLSEEQKKLRDKRKEECDNEAKRLETLETSGSRIRMSNPDGTSRYLSPDEIIKEMEVSRNFLKDACGRP